MTRILLFIYFYSHTVIFIYEQMVFWRIAFSLTSICM